MDQKLIKKDIVDRISEKLSEDRIVVGGGKENYKRKYHLKFSKPIIEKVLNAFLDVLVDAIAEGDSICFRNHMTIETKYRQERKYKPNGFYATKEMISPAGFRLKVKPHSQIKNACKVLTEKVHKENVDQETV